MKISKKAYYGLRAMVHLAKDGETCSIHTMARKEALPEDYLEKIVQELRKAGLVKAIKGLNGGYALASNPQHITANHILKTLDGSLVPFPCSPSMSPTTCSLEETCATSDVWRKLSDSLEKTLNSITLADLIR